MFLINNYIIYGMVDICKVKNVSNLKGEGVDPKKLYYTLEPVQSRGSIIYTPVENNKVMMRCIISKEEALKLIEAIPALESIRVTDVKKGEQIYKEALKKNECNELMRIFKFLYMNEWERSTNNKKMSLVDRKYLDLIRDRLFGEIALALEYTYDEVEKEVENILKPCSML